MTIEQQIDRLTQGCVDVVRLDDLASRLALGRPLVVKVGFDPTAPDLHLGHTVLIRKMKHFQDLGHTVVFVVGDFTGMIGDPTGRSKTRPPLTTAEIERNAETYKTQVFKLLDPQKTVVEFNSRWLIPLGSDGLIKLASNYNVAQMLERRDFKQRYEAGQPIAIHEFLYSLVQAFDSVALRADVELGGTDQLFNLNVGRDIMPAFDLPPQIVMTTPLLEGLDGVEKMSKSLGNYVGVTDAPRRDVRQADVDQRPLMWRYYLLLTDLTAAEVEAHEGTGRRRRAPSETGQGGSGQAHRQRVPWRRGRRSRRRGVRSRPRQRRAAVGHPAIVVDLRRRAVTGAHACAGGCGTGGFHQRRGPEDSAGRRPVERVEGRGPEAPGGAWAAPPVLQAGRRAVRLVAADSHTGAGR